MRYLSLFSGIEAASAAWVPLGWEPVAFCEVEPFPCAVLARRFPEVPNLGDVTKVDWSEFVNSNAVPGVLVGGSPCQSFSVAGRREGLGGESGLMWEYVRAVREVRPRWLVWENVPGALSSTHGEDFGCLLRELDDLGYGLAWRVLDSMFFGVAQRRRRVFLVGRLGDPRGPAAVLLEPHCLRWDTPTSREKRKELAARAGCRAEGAGRETPIGFSWHNGGSTNLSVGDTSPCIGSHMQPAVAIAQNQRGEPRVDGGDGQTMGAIPATRSGKQLQMVICRASGQAHAETCEDMAPTLSARQHKDPPIVGDGMVVRRIMPVEAERLQGLPDGWTDVPYRGREHPADTPRYKAIGNSMAVPVMQWIGKRIAAYELLEGGES
ncbi:DNA cytosine methyltransferase [Olsenella uli]|uniref:DNA cytosine methyltransferase n=1 Tax=Olsenella uli TaxID=133926 RepID=UPI0004515B99|nr:DNA cytosine methyltransferase [Olsenella uli]EUB32662.1 DNA (cytosine-5-)-methyltransferase [Olsenella uli MSTE5]